MANIQKIRIDQQLAELGIKSTPAKLNIKYPRAQMKIKTENARMEIDRKAPSFRINRKKMSSDFGTKAPLEFAKENRDKGRTGACYYVSLPSGAFVLFDALAESKLWEEESLHILNSSAKIIDVFM